MAAPLIQLNGIGKRFVRADMTLDVLKNVDLDIHQGEFLALRGPSGSGKSSLLNILGLLDRPSTGQYRIAGADTAQKNDDELSSLRNMHFGFIFQSFHLIPYITVLDNVLMPGLYGPTAKRTLKKRAEELLGLVGLADRKNFKPTNLSGGQQQRVAVARALVNDPEVILADEPTGQLDSATSTEIMNLLARINERGKTVVVVTHDDKTAAYAKRLVMVEDGRVREA